MNIVALKQHADHLSFLLSDPHPADYGWNKSVEAIVELINEGMEVSVSRHEERGAPFDEDLTPHIYD